MHERIAIIGGTGDLGFGLARRWAFAGIEIVIGSRHEQKARAQLAPTIGGKATRVLGLWQGSAAAQARELAPAGTRVLSAFHNVSAEVLQELSAFPDCDVLICGDDQGAKKMLSTLIKRIPGLRPVDAGSLEMARIVESLTALLISVNQRYKVKHSGIRITGVAANSA